VPITIGETLGGALLAAVPDVARRLLDVAVRLAPPYPVLTPVQVVRCLGRGLRRGDVRFGGEVVRRGVRLLGVWREQHRCRTRLAAPDAGVRFDRPEDAH
jgi:hypothetical protein